MSDNVSVGKRRRIYERKFDWTDARRRYAAGESMLSLAKEYGVNPSAVQRVIRLPEYRVAAATPEQMAALSALARDQVPCPRCERPMSRAATLCKPCHGETRAFAETTLRKIPGQRRAILAAVPVGRIVKCDGRWGVVVGGYERRLVDFWDGGREYVSAKAVVTVAPSLSILVGGVEEAPEEIAA